MGSCGSLWQLTPGAQLGQAGLCRVAAGGRASNSRNRLVSRILYFETQTRVRETECSDTETVMIVFWLLNLIWALLGSATGIDKKTSNIWLLDFCNIFQFCSDWINWVWPEPDRGWAGRRKGGLPSWCHAVTYSQPQWGHGLDLKFTFKFQPWIRMNWVTNASELGMINTPEFWPSW